MAHFIDFGSCNCFQRVDVRVNVNLLSRIHFNNQREIILDFSNFKLKVCFDPKTQKAKEFATYIQDGNYDISPYIDSISYIAYYHLDL